MARKILDDEGKIDKNSEIYEQNKPENKISHKEEIKNLTPAQKWQYFKDYHLKNVMIVLAILALLIFSFKDSLSKDDVVLRIAIEDSSYLEEDVEKMEKKIHDKLGLPEDKVVEVDIGYNSDSYELINKLQTYLQAGTVDVVIAPEEAIKWYSETGFFMEPDTYDEVKFYENIDEKYRFYSVYQSGENIRGEEEQSGDLYNYGLY
nr:hypothetical protein [Lachnospiraceae bacterium]